MMSLILKRPFYSRLDANTYVFEGKTLIKDFCKITESEYSLFNEIKGEADTLAGLILEIRKELPARGEKLQLLHFEFEIDSVDNRRIKRVKVKIKAE
jgi:putative hemolysin